MAAETMWDRFVRSPPASVLALLVAMASFTSGASLAKHLFSSVGPEGATTLRLVGGALMLAAVLRPWRNVRSAPLLRIAVYGLAMAGMNFLFYKALATVPLGIAVALEFSGPLVVTVASSRAPIDFLWIGLAVAGLALLLPLHGTLHPLDPRGVAEALGAGAFWAIYILSGKKAGEAHGASTTALGMAVGAVAIAPVGLAHAGAALLKPAVLLPGLGVALLSSAFPYTLEMFALRRLRVQTYGTLTSCEPAVGALAGFFLLGESLDVGQLVAIALIVVAAAGATSSAALAQRSLAPPLG